MRRTMSDKDTFHKKSEFPKFPWDKVDPEKFGKDWSTCKTGYGNPDLPSAHCIYMVKKDLSADYWEMPEALANMLDAHAEMAAREAKARIREALGI